MCVDPCCCWWWGVGWIDTPGLGLVVGRGLSAPGRVWGGALSALTKFLGAVVLCAWVGERVSVVAGGGWR